MRSCNGRYRLCNLCIVAHHHNVLECTKLHVIIKNIFGDNVQLTTNNNALIQPTAAKGAQNTAVARSAEHFKEIFWLRNGGS